MSCIGQSDAAQSRSIAPAKAPICRRVTIGWPDGTASGPMTRTA